ncbi:MAG: type III-B CRISPR-associated protein Cas10/Cmr2 [Methylobacter sp.]
MVNKTLHFNFTPVQSFVAQARRTRDLWAGSYLLAWLSGQAMAAIIKDGGKIEMPYVDGDLLIQAIQNPQEFFRKKSAEEQAKLRRLGTLPNRFSAQIPEDLDPAIYTKVIQDKWITVANAVRNKIDPGKKLIADEFWDRQINNHWEFAWVTGESSLDSRKNLRLPNTTEESGEKCTVCGERQELSESKKTEFVPNRKASKAWWKNLQQSELDLRENERLCAVCLTKRLFPSVAEQAINWEVDKYYPSTAYLSAIDWLEDVLKKAKDDETVRNAANGLVSVAEELNIYKSEYNTRIQCLSEHLEGSGIGKSFIDWDGNVFYLSAIAAGQLQKRGNNETLSPDEKNKLSEALKKLQKAAGSSATPFYALLLMDGDGMGKLIGGLEDQDKGKVSKALADFTGQVPDIVNKNNGRLVYAGGDEVFALLPVSTAIKCAAECRAAYRKAFENFPEKTKNAATISAAVQFAHQNIALSVVVKDAHRLLDDIAKDRSGRDALACRVWKPGGIVLTWAQPWTDGHQTDFAQLLDEVIADLRPDPTNNRFSSKFFYKLRDLFEQIESDSAITDDAIQDLLIAEYIDNRELKKNDKEKLRNEATDRIQKLLLLCQQQTRHYEENKPITYAKGKYNTDAALLVRFLVQKEV